MKLKVLLFILILIDYPFLYGQSINLPMVHKELFMTHINKYDSVGNKCGYWCENSDETITFNFYTSGRKNGITQVYRKTSTDKYYLQASGCYKDDIPCSQWQ